MLERAGNLTPRSGVEPLGWGENSSDRPEHAIAHFERARG